jgi:phosphohistidine phosphatase
VHCCRIAHDASAKELKVYGYSVGFGRADHAVSRDVLAAEYPGYTITISDEGY